MKNHTQSLSAFVNDVDTTAATATATGNWQPHEATAKKTAKENATALDECQRLGDTLCPVTNIPFTETCAEILLYGQLFPLPKFRICIILAFNISRICSHTSLENQYLSIYIEQMKNANCIKPLFDDLMGTGYN